MNCFSSSFILQVVLSRSSKLKIVLLTILWLSPRYWSESWKLIETRELFYLKNLTLTSPPRKPLGLLVNCPMHYLQNVRRYNNKTPSKGVDVLKSFVVQKRVMKKREWWRKITFLMWIMFKTNLESESISTE